MTTFILPADSTARGGVLGRAIAFLSRLPNGQAWLVTVELFKPKRTTEQNAYLWGVCYATILKQGANLLAGWEADDLHDYYLGEHTGWEVIEGFGRKRMKPVKRSSKMNKQEFANYIDFVQRRAAEIGIVIPDAEGG